MELWQEVKVNKWRRLDNAKVMGWQTAAEARSMASFFENLYSLGYDKYTTNQLSAYIDGQVRGYQFNEQAYADMSITTTHDLHNIQCSSYGLHDFDNYMSKRWQKRFEYARDMGI
jgi:hypothetical protein